MSPDYERVIAQEEKVLASIQEQSEKLIPELKRTAAVFLRDWAIALLKGYLKRGPESTSSLSPAKAEGMKKEFTAILEAFPAAVDGHREVGDTQDTGGGDPGCLVALVFLVVLSFLSVVIVVGELQFAVVPAQFLFLFQAVLIHNLRRAAGRVL